MSSPRIVPSLARQATSNPIKLRFALFSTFKTRLKPRTTKSTSANSATETITQETVSEVVPSHTLTPQMVSEVARWEGGNPKGSMSAMMQSELTKQRQANRAVVGIGSELDDGHITSEMVSAVSQIEGGATKGSMGSMSSKMQRKMTKQRRANRFVVDVGSKFDESHITHEAVLRVAKKEGDTFKGPKPAEMRSHLVEGSQLDKDRQVPFPPESVIPHTCIYLKEDVVHSDGCRLALSLTITSSYFCLLSSRPLALASNDTDFLSSRASSNKTKITKPQPPPHSSLDPTPQFRKSQAEQSPNFEPVAPQQPGSKPRTVPPSPTQQPTPFLSHRPLKATPVTRQRPPPRTLAAEALRLSLINLKRKAAHLKPATPSTEKAFQHAFTTVNAKLETDPTQLRMQDLKLLRRAEKRARGIVTGSLGFTARVERVVQENYKEHNRLRRAAKEERARLRRAAKEKGVVP